MLIKVEDLTQTDIEKISVGDIVNYTTGAPQMSGEKIKSSPVAFVDQTKLVFENTAGVLKKNITRFGCLSIVSIDIKNI